jgi:hypothetical protein
MGEVRYEVRVRGRECDAVLAAAQEGLEVGAQPVRTVLHGRLPDQAALAGILNTIWLLGLELVEVRRLPQDGPGSRRSSTTSRPSACSLSSSSWSAS